METEAETLEHCTKIRALDCAPKVQLKSGRSETLSKEIKTMMGTPLKQFT